MRVPKFTQHLGIKSLMAHTVRLWRLADNGVGPAWDLFAHDDDMIVHLVGYHVCTTRFLPWPSFANIGYICDRMSPFGDPDHPLFITTITDIPAMDPATQRRVTDSHLLHLVHDRALLIELGFGVKIRLTAPRNVVFKVAASAYAEVCHWQLDSRFFIVVPPAPAGQHYFRRAATTQTTEQVVMALPASKGSLALMAGRVASERLPLRLQTRALVSSINTSKRLLPPLFVRVLRAEIRSRCMVELKVTDGTGFVRIQCRFPGINGDANVQTRRIDSAADVPCPAIRHAMLLLATSPCVMIHLFHLQLRINTFGRMFELEGSFGESYECLDIGRLRDSTFAICVCVNDHLLTSDGAHNDFLESYLRRTKKYGVAATYDQQAFPVPIWQDCPYGCGAKFFHDWEFVESHRAAGTDKKTRCCHNGVRKLSDEALRPPDFLRHFVEEWKLRTGDPRFFCKYDRELNQLVAVAVLGVETLPTDHRRPVPNVRGSAVFQRYKSSMVSMNGKCMMFKSRCDIESLALRSHPLCGAFATYLFAEPGRDEPIAPQFTEAVPGSVRADFCHENVLLCARALRALLTKFNPMIQWVRKTYGHIYVADLSFEKFYSVSEAQLNQGGSANKGQLMCLRKREGNFMRTPITVMQVVNNLKEVVFTFDANKQQYHQAAFPLLDPAGLQGWDVDMKRGTWPLAPFKPCTFNNYIDCFFRQCLYPRENFPRLWQECVLDAISRRDAMNDEQAIRARVQFRDHQNGGAERRFRVATVRELTDSDKWFDTGQLFQLPVTLRGSPLYKIMKVEQGMGLVRQFGRPHFFITMTAGKDDDAFQANLAGTNTEWFENPWLMNSLFEKQRQDLRLDLLSGFSLFPGSPALYYQDVIEFQLRGQPHVHALVRMPWGDFDVPGEVEKHVSCGIPKNDTELAVLVKTYMTHSCYPGRCFKDPDDIDERTGRPRCHYGFPKRVTAETHRNEKDGYWHLKRDPGEEWVVSYNPELLRRFRCHINVEPVASDASILYLQKYIRKNVDTAKSKLVKNPRDMTLAEQYASFHLARAMTSSEACWTIQDYSFAELYPTVDIIACHLPDEQKIVFCEDSYQDIIETCHTRLTDLLRYFQRRRCPDLDGLLVEAFFAKYSVPSNPDFKAIDPATGLEVAYFNPTLRLESKGHLAFLRSVSFGNRELFSLYTLLRRRAAHSFEELLGGSTSFYAACVFHGYFSEGEHSLWQFALDDMAVVRSRPPEYVLRHFAHMLTNSGPTVKREALFCEFWRYMVTSHRGSRDSIPGWVIGGLRTRHVMEVMHDLQRLLAKDGIDIKDLINFTDLCLNHQPLLTMEELCASAQNLHGMPEAALAPFDRLRLTDEQNDIYERIVSVAEEQMITAYGDHIYGDDHFVRSARPPIPTSPDSFYYINGSAGTGKTFLLNTMIKYLIKDYRVKVASCAMTGVAASLLLGGVTAHRLFGLPVEDCDPAESTSSSRLHMKSLGARMLRDADVIIIDEFSVLHKGNLEKILRLFQEIQTMCAGGNNFAVPIDRTYGGKLFIFAGDFQQMTPVVPGHASCLQSAVLGASSCSHPIFQRCVVMKLTEPRRASEDAAFAQWLQDKVAQGDDSDDGSSVFSVTLPPQIKVYTPDTVIDALSRYTTVIAPFNDTVHKYRALLTPFHTDDDNPLIRLEATYDQRTVNIATHVLEQEMSPQLPPHVLDISVGMPLMLLRNISVADGLCNGSVLTCGAIHSHTLALLDKFGREHEIPRMRLAMPTAAPTTTEVYCHRIQFPVVPAFSITNNKSQGTTQPVIPYPEHRPMFHPPVLLDLTNNVHSHGALYVGLSRVRGFKWIGVVVTAQMLNCAPHVSVRNIVYRDLLRMARLLPPLIDEDAAQVY